MGEIDTKISLAIKSNNCATNDPCAVCGRRTDPAVGPEIFLHDSWHLVCHPCAEEIDPVLLRIQEKYWSQNTCADLLRGALCQDGNGNFAEPCDDEKVPF